MARKIKHNFFFFLINGNYLFREKGVFPISFFRKLSLARLRDEREAEVRVLERFKNYYERVLKRTAGDSIIGDYRIIITCENFFKYIKKNY